MSSLEKPRLKKNSREIAEHNVLPLSNKALTGTSLIVTGRYFLYEDWGADSVEIPGPVKLGLKNHRVLHLLMR